MKKYLIFFIGIISFIGINTVNADTRNYTYRLYVENLTFEENLSFFTNHEEILSKLYDGIYEDYLENYSNLYPYYSIFFRSDYSCIDCINGESIYVHMRMYLNKPVLNINSDNLSNPIVKADYITEFSYNTATNAYILPIKESNLSKITNFLSISYFYSNFDLILNLDGITSFSSISVTTLPSSNYTYTLSSGDIVPTVQEFFNLDIISDPNSPNSSYTEINLNNYEYVALSLKDYSVTNQFYTNVYVKGNYCLTPVYNYGMTEKVDYYSGYQVERCSPYYEKYTSVRTYILEQDLKNHAIYYLKAYDTSKENLVKIDTSVFDITYITNDNKDNPYVTIDGKTYPAISYDKLSSTSTKSEDEDYISGVSCQVGDFNCYEEYNPNNIFNDLFDKPLEKLKSVWTAITSIFAIITEFILLLPPTMQGFLYVAFGISIILGIIKIIL